MSLTVQNRRAVLGLVVALLVVVLTSCDMEGQPASEQPAPKTPETPEAPETPDPPGPQTPGPTGPQTPDPAGPQTPDPTGPQTPDPTGPQVPGPSTPSPTPPPSSPASEPVVSISGSSGAGGGSVTFERTGDTSDPLTIEIYRCGPFTDRLGAPCGVYPAVPFLVHFATNNDSATFSLNATSGQEYHVRLRNSANCSPRCGAYTWGDDHEVTVLVS